MRNLWAHNGAITSLSFSRDGRTLAAGSDDKTIKLWRVRDAKVLWTSKGHAAAVNAVAFNPNGQSTSIASGSSDQTIKLWSARDGKILRTLKGHSSWVDALALSPNGKLLANGSWDKTIKIWDSGSGQLRRTLKGRAGWINAVAWSRDGSLVAGGGDKTVAVWNASDGKMTRKIAAGDDRITALAFGSAALFMTGGADQTAKLWDWRSGKVLYALKGFSGREEKATLAHLWNAQGAAAPDAKTAIAGYQRADSLDPKTALYALNLASAFNQNARFAEAQRLLETRLKVLWLSLSDHQSLQNSLGDTHFRWAQNLAQHGAYAEARSHYFEALYSDRRLPDDANFNYQSSQTSAALGDWTDAARGYESALSSFRRAKDSASEAATLNNLGLAYQALSRFDQAAKCFNGALKISHAGDERAGQGAALSNLAVSARSPHRSKARAPKR